MAATAKALGHPARLAILRRLAREGACACGALVQELPLAQSTVSQHLKELVEANLITAEAEGQSNRYRVHTGALALLEASLAELVAELRAQAACACGCGRVPCRCGEARPARAATKGRSIRSTEKRGVKKIDEAGHRKRNPRNIPDTRGRA